MPPGGGGGGGSAIQHLAVEFFQHVLVNTWVGGIQLEEVKQSFCNSHNGGVLQLIVQSMIPSSLCGSVRVCVVRAVRAVRAIRADPCGSVRSVRSVRYVRVRAGPCGPCGSVWSSLSVITPTLHNSDNTNTCAYICVSDASHLGPDTKHVDHNHATCTRETAHTNTTAECCTPTSLAWSAPPPRCPPVHPSGHHSNTSFIR